MTLEDWYVAGCVALTLAMALAVGVPRWREAGRGKR